MAFSLLRLPFSLFPRLVRLVVAGVIVRFAAAAYHVCYDYLHRSWLRRACADDDDDVAAAAAASAQSETHSKSKRSSG